MAFHKTEENHTEDGWSMANYPGRSRHGSMGGESHFKIYSVFIDLEERAKEQRWT